MLRGKYQIIPAILIVLIISQGIAYYNIATMDEDSSGGNFMMVEIEHRNSDGVLLETRCIEDDLILRNFAYWLAVQGAGGDYVEILSTLRAKKTDGALVTHQTGRIDFAPFQSFVCIGEGTTAPVITDYVLESLAMQEYIVDRLYWNSGTQFNVTIDGLFLIDGTYTITEIGLGASLETTNVLMARDTFLPINVNAGDTLTTRYYLLANWGG